MFTLSRDLVLLLVRGAKTRVGHDLRAELGLGQGAGSGWVDAEHLFTIWKALERRSGDANLGLHLGEIKGTLPASNVLFASMLASPTVGSALERLCRYHAVVADLVQPMLTVTGGTAVLTWKGPNVLHRQQAECIVSLAVSILRQLAGRPQEICVAFAHPRPVDLREHERILGRKLEFDAPRLALFFPAELLAIPVAPHSGELLGVLDSHAEQLLTRARQGESMKSKVARLLNLAIGDGQPKLASVAHSIGMSGRALQSKLRDDKTSFQQVLDKVRLEKASRLLTKDELQISEVAFLMGYSDQSAFNHAFKRWTGHSPRSFRQREQTPRVHPANLDPTSPGS
jgi:AraC-like DNA-binding protein